MQDPLVLAAQAILVATAANISGSAYADLIFADEAPIAVAFTNALTRMGISDSAAAQAVAVMGYSIDSATFCRLRNGSRQQYTRDETLFYTAVAVALAQHMHLHRDVDREGILAAAIDLVLRATRHRLWQISKGTAFTPPFTDPVFHRRRLTSALPSTTAATVHASASSGEDILKLGTRTAAT